MEKGLTENQYRLKTEAFCKLRSTCKSYNEYGSGFDTDIHGLTWDERPVLKVLAYDRTNSLIHVQNENGITWISDLKKMEFCLENGDKIINH